MNEIKTVETFEEIINNGDTNIVKFLPLGVLIVQEWICSLGKSWKQIMTKNGIV